ncbi:MAG: PAS domain S-box protein [Magnetococcales bacterium]|nr:PAS domain S-box protein [Magnetococcales bacterium]
MFSLFNHSSLARQAFQRILASLAMVLLFLGLAVWWIQKTTYSKMVTIETDFLRKHYREQIDRKEQNWKLQAIMLRSELEFQNLLVRGAAGWEALKGFLAVRQGGSQFRHLLVTDDAGRILFHYGSGTLFTDDASFPEKEEGRWYFSEALNSLFFYQRQRIWLGQMGAGQLIVLVAMDGELLHQISFPGTSLGLEWNRRMIACSNSVDLLNPTSAQCFNTAADATLDMTIDEKLPWGGTEKPSPILVVNRSIEPLFTVQELLLSLALVFLGGIVLLHFSVGHWLLLQARRVNLLGQVADGYSRNNRITAQMVTTLDEVRCSQDDEISIVAQSLFEMTQVVEQRLEERRIHEEKLAESENRLREITSMIADGVFVIDVRDEVTFLNPQGERLLGWKQEELIGKSSHDLFHHVRPDGSSNPVDRCPIHRTLVDGSSNRVYEDYFVRRDGTFLPVALASAPIVRDGVVKGAVITFQDIGDRLKVEKEIQKIQERFQRLFNIARDATFVVAMHPDGRFGNFLEVNDATCLRYGYSREELLRLTPSVINPPEGQEDLERLAHDIMTRNHATFERWHVTRDGRRIPVEVNSQMFEFQGHPAVLSLVRDISERKRAEEIILESENRFRTLIHSLRDAILVFDASGKIMLLNRSGERMFGLSDAEFVGLPVSGLFSQIRGGVSWDHLSQRFDAPGAEGMSITHEGMALRSMGDEEFPVEISITSWTNHGERFFSAVVRDISERQLLERRDLRAYINRIAISALLEVALEPLPLKRKLEVAMDIIHTVPRLALQAKGSIMLVTEEGDLELIVERNLSAPLLEKCRRVPIGHCLCGRAAESRELIFADAIDARHDITFDGIQPHGHYCVPILSRGNLLGVMNLYVAAGHVQEPEEGAFLITVANTLAGLIERGRVEEKIKHMASHDSLTGLPNRVLFREHLEQELRHASRTKRALVVAFLDLDRFKQVNDTLGHEAGDLLLKAVTLRLRQCLRESDTLARIGGDEFTLILPAIDCQANAVNVAEKIIAILQEPFIILEHTCRIGVSIGMSCFPDHGFHADELIQQADQAMYIVKNTGRNAFAFFNGSSELDSPAP